MKKEIVFIDCVALVMSICAGMIGWSVIKNGGNDSGIGLIMLSVGVSLIGRVVSGFWFRRLKVLDPVLAIFFFICACLGFVIMMGVDDGEAVGVVTFAACALGELVIMSNYANLD